MAVIVIAMAKVRTLYASGSGHGVKVKAVARRTGWASTGKRGSLGYERGFRRIKDIHTGCYVGSSLNA